MSLAGSFITFVYFSGFELLQNKQLKIELKKWECLKKLFCGNIDKLRQFKKYFIILLPIILSVVDTYSDANYCFGIATGEGIFDIGKSRRDVEGSNQGKQLKPEHSEFIGQRIMLCFLFIGNI